MRCALYCILLVTVLGWTPSAGALTFNTEFIAVTGDVAPDGNGTFSGFEVPGLAGPPLNDAGQAAVGGNLTATSGGSSDDRGTFRGDRAGLVQIAREGKPAPDGNGHFFIFGAPALNDIGQSAFVATLNGTNDALNETDRRGIFRGDGISGPIQIARGGQAAPDGNGRFNDFSATPAVNAAGQVAFGGFLSGTAGGFDDNYGYFRGDGGTLVQIVRNGQTAPGGIRHFSSILGSAFNDAGQVAFNAVVSGTTGEDSYNPGVFRGDGGALTQIALYGQPAPDGNGTFGGFSGPALNDTGQAAFSAGLTGTAGGTSDNQGIFRGDGGAITQIARSGKPAPDGNGHFLRFADPALNETGQAAFIGFLSDTRGGSSDAAGIFRGDGVSGPIQIARAGQAVPSGNGNLSSFFDPALNDLGQVAFSASLTGTVGGAADNAALFFFDQALGLVQVARKGDTLLGSTITGLFFGHSVGNNGNERSGLNQLGQLAYQFALADGRSGIAIVTFVPEPSTLASIPIVLFVVFALRLGRRASNSRFVAS